MQELEYLRDEMNQRIIFSYDNYNKILGNVLFVLGGTLAIFSAMQENIAPGKSNLSMFCFFLMITVFFISVLVMYFSSQRVGENLNQIFRIAAYCTVFYEERLNRTKETKRFWELATFDMMIKEMMEPEGKRNYTMNREHILLPILAVVLMVLFLVIFVAKAHLLECPEKCISMDYSDWSMFGVCIIYIIVSLVLSLRISTFSLLNPQKWLNIKKRHLASFIDYAIENKHYNEDDLLERFGENFLKDVLGENFLEHVRGINDRQSLKDGGVRPEGSSEVGSPHSSDESRESAWNEAGDKSASSLKRPTESTKRPTAVKREREAN